MEGRPIMVSRFELRKQQLLADCQVPPATFRGAIRRLEAFAQPFVDSMPSPEIQEYSRIYLAGLLSDLPRKNAEAIAYRNDLDRQRIQEFIGYSDWDREPMQTELARQVGQEIGRPDGVIVFDPSAFPKKGTASVGVQRQWCGRLGKVENCQVGVYLGYVSEAAHTLVAFRLYLPKEWARNKARRTTCGVPENLRYQTRHALALEMLEQRGAMLPHGWVSGDDEMGRPAWFRRELNQRKERYLLAVPSNTSVRDLEAEPPSYGGKGRRRKTPFQQVRAWCEALPAEAWSWLSVRDGEKGPLEVEIVKRRVESKVEGLAVGFEELLVAVRYVDGGKLKYDYHVSNAAVATPLEELARVAKAEHRIEECLKRSKSESGLGQYQVRNWDGWQNHQTLSLIATWFLLLEARRGKKEGTGLDGSPGASGLGADLSQGMSLRYPGAQRAGADALAGAERVGEAVPLQFT
jgi:SRSO17 transposase